VGFDVEAFLRGHFWALAIAAAAVAGCLAVWARMHDRARALRETGALLARVRAALEDRRGRGFDVPLLARVDALVARLRRIS
jgi:hypothetical protein